MFFTLYLFMHMQTNVRFRVFKTHLMWYTSNIIHLFKEKGKFMNSETYTLIENYMLSCMQDSAHDEHHIYRVLYNALEIAKEEMNVDYDILICSCLLHDIGRKEQFENPRVCHALAGAEKAYTFLIHNNFDETFAQKVRYCIETHRYRKNNQPQSMEAKILFDADKLDAAGALGIARTLIYKGKVSEPLYSLTPDGYVSNGAADISPSFFQEYKYKLEGLYAHFYTKKATELAKLRQTAAINFYNDLFEEVTSSYQNGRNELQQHLEPQERKAD